MRIAIIPARGGSKRIPRKNVRDFCGRPMIAWPIKAARESGCFDHIIVSTDDEEIARIARREGAEIPFTRPDELSGDHVPTRPVINHAITLAESHVGPIDTVCCIYPAAPFLDGELLRHAFEVLEHCGADFVFSAGGYAAPIQRSFRIGDDGAAERLWPEHRLTRSQDLEPAYHDAGQFYWGRSKAFIEGADPVSSRGRPFVLPRWRVHDIDTQEDWEFASLVFRALK